MPFKRLTMLLWILSLTQLQAAPKSYYPEVTWRTLETTHMVIHYHPGVEWTAHRVHSIAESVYQQVTERYAYQPKEKIHVVVRDLEDIANGFAVWHLNWITLWATPSNFPLRGHHDWVRGTLLHELSHIVSLQASAAFGQRIEGIRFGGLEDSLTAHHFDIGASVFLTSNPAPRWWAEAVAQWDSARSGYDKWDSLQEMLLRTSHLENNLLTLDELHNIRVRENFGQELVYNQGFHFVTYLHQVCGDDLNRRLATAARQRKHLDFAKTFASICGKSLKVLDAEWRQQLRAHYATQLSQLGGPKVEGERIAFRHEQVASDPPGYEGGIWNFSPQFSPDGHFYSFATNNRVILHHLEKPFDLAQLKEQPAAKLLNEEPRETNDPNLHWSSEDTNAAAASKLEMHGSSWSLALKGRTFSWAPDSKRLLVSRKLHRLDGGYQTYDLLLVDLSASPQRQPQERRLTRRGRAMTPAWSPDGKQIAYAKNQDGTITLHVFAWGDGLDSTPTHTIAHPLGSQSLEPVWSRDSKQIFYTHTPLGADRSEIWVYDLTKRSSRPLLADAADYRHPFVDINGQLWLASDRSGIFQIYRLDLTTRQIQQITRVSSGAFHPHYLAHQNRLIYSRFSSYGFKPHYLDTPLALSNETLAEPSTDLVATSAGAQPTLAASRPYRFDLRPARFFPTIIFEDRLLKAGLSMQLSDYLEKHNLLAAAVLGRDQDYHVSYLNRQWPLEFFLNYSRFVRASNDLQLFDDGDSLADEPITKTGFDIDFVSAGLQKSLYPETFLNGDHQLALSYNLRRVERDFGVPLLLDSADPTSAATSVDLITNHDVSGEWRYRYFVDEHHPQLDVNPRDGREWRLNIAHVWSEPFGSAAYDFNRFMVHFSEYWAIPKTLAQTLELRFTGGFIDRDVNPNDEFYAGGRLNFRAFGDINANSSFMGYEAYSIRGETLLVGALTYRFPVVRRLAKKSGVVYWDSLFGALFTEVGNAWNHGETANCNQNVAAITNCGDGNLLLQDVGAELRLKAFLFNDFNPWNSVARVAYGFQDSANYGFRDDDLPVRFFFGLGTNF